MGNNILPNGGMNPATSASLDLENRLKVLVLEPRKLFKECLADFLAQFPGVETITDAKDSAEHANSPDVLLLCIPDGEHLPTDASELPPALVGVPSLPIVVLSNDRCSGEIFDLLKAGVRGFIPTSTPGAVAIQILRLVHAGGVFIPLSSLSSVTQHSDRTSDRSDVFTVRQRQVIKAIQLGKPNKIIAYELNMCESTVKVHVRTIMKKLKAKNRTEVAYLYSSSIGSATEDEFLQLNSVPSNIVGGSDGRAHVAT